MKKTILASLIVTALVALPDRAQVIISDVPVNGVTTGTLTSQMPGSSSDYIFFNAEDYSNNLSHPETNYNGLTSFFIAGGLQGTDYVDNTVNNPAGTAVSVGTLQASGSQHFAFAIRPGSKTDENNDGGGNGDNANVPPIGLNPNFNYNDFNVYVLFSATGDSTRDTDLSLDLRVNGVLTQGLHPVAVTDDNTNTSMGKYIEFNVTGLGTLLATGANADLVLDGNSNNPLSYVNAVSFQSVPEPSTYALLLAGVAFFGFLIRRKVARLSV